MFMNFFTPFSDEIAEVGCRSLLQFISAVGGVPLF